ncbi:hypothetical protein ES703_37023 [subsurface metagenome]
MMRRIVGQCGQSDFSSIEHLASVLNAPEMLDTSTLTNRQKFACYFIVMTRDKDIPWQLVRSVVREVLFWGEDANKITHTEVKLARDRSKLKEVQKFRALW